MSNYDNCKLDNPWDSGYYKKYSLDDVFVQREKLQMFEKEREVLIYDFEQEDPFYLELNAKKLKKAKEDLREMEEDAEDELLENDLINLI